MMHYSGNADWIVPTDGTQRWIDGLNLPILEKWRTFIVDDHVGGWIEEYQGLTLAVVHGAGHMVPENKPREMHHVLFNWINENPI